MECVGGAALEPNTHKSSFIPATGKLWKAESPVVVWTDLCFLVRITGVIYQVVVGEVSVPTWEVDRSVDRCTRGYRGVNQVRVLQPEPSSERARVRAAERHPPPVAQPPGLSDHGAKVSQVRQRLAAAEEAQVVGAQVTKERREQLSLKV